MDIQSQALQPQFQAASKLQFEVFDHQNLLFLSFQNSIFYGRHCVTDALDILI